MANEAVAAHYTIERSFDGIVFSVAGNMAAWQNTDDANNYTYKDIPADNSHSTAYYRIRCTMANGVEVLSKTIAVTKSMNNRQLTVTPNPVKTDAGILFSATHSAPVWIRLVDLQGNTVLAKQYPASQGMNTIYLHNLQAFPDGIYLLQVDDGTKLENTKLVIRQ